MLAPFRLRTKGGGAITASPRRAGGRRFLSYTPAPLRRADWGVAAAIGLAAAIIALWNHAAIDPSVYRTFNIFFQADPPRVISNLTERWSPFQNRNVAHPLFSILGLSAIKAGGIVGIAPQPMIAALLAAAAFVSAGAFFLAMRGLAMPRPPALAFTCAYVSSAAFLHWYAFTETYAFSATTIAVAIAVLTCARSSSLWLWAAASTATLSMLLTNWSFGLAAAAMRLRVRHFVLVTGIALAAVSCLSFVQHKTLHNARFFLDPAGIARERTFSGPQMLRLGMRWNPRDSLRDGLVTPAIVPMPEVVTEPTEAGPFTIVTNQFVPLSRLGIAGGVALAAWAVLLAIGSYAALSEESRRPVGIALLAFALFQTAFHVFYGEITFLYAADTLPAMMAIAALGWFTDARKLVMAALILFIGTAAVTNEARFLHAARLSHDVAIAKTMGLAFGR